MKRFVFFISILIFNIYFCLPCFAKDITVNVVGFESGIESSDFYIVERDTKWTKSNIKQLYQDYELNEAYFLVDNSLSDTVICDIYTGWDEYVTSVELSTKEDNYINGICYKPVNLTIPIIEITCDIDEYRQMQDDLSKSLFCNIDVNSIMLGIYDKSATLAGHGNTTWAWGENGKKPYNLSFDKKCKINGIGEAKDFVLLANIFDCSQYKNGICFELAHDLGLLYTPYYELTHLFVNGTYKGIYSLTNKIKHNNGIMRLDDEYLFCLGANNPKQRIEFNSDIYYVDSDEIDGKPYVDLKYPKEVSEAEKEMISRAVENMFDALEKKDEARIERILDLDSMAKLYWIEEISMNYDALSRSIYFYYDKSTDKIYAGPVWDMDMSFGLPEERFGIDFSSPLGWKIRDLGWWSYLCDVRCFKDKCIQVYNEYDMPLILTESLNRCRENTSVLSTEGNVNYKMFPASNELHNLWESSSYDEYCVNLAEFYSDRIDFINTEMATYYNPHYEMRLYLYYLLIFVLINIAIFALFKIIRHKR